ncbi:LysR family transcriptional regulator [Thalassotalea psychrophila]|uniref:LysR family transcriptional regulator n=1 Tax=Thalassotalea psychrophila TaxID=3065647 RepID=A0ABY9TYF5_9GAMM|nr:LysR family transcriptional regulator [Colwelliaceae bacterium SQ149]
MDNSTEKQLNRIDLNLLIALSVLLKEKNVSKAAEVLFLTQSAMSKTLKRLRDLFNDELLFRSANKMHITIKGEQLQKQLPTLLASLNSFMQEDKFDPITCDMSFSVSVPAAMNHSVLLPLLQILAEQAPKIRITEHPALVDPYNMLENNDIDFAIHFADNNDANFTVTPCEKFSLAIFSGKHHPLLCESKGEVKKNISYEDCLQYNFIAMNHGDNTQTKITSTIHAILNEPKYIEKLVFKSNQLLLITELLATTDSLYIGPEHLLRVSNLSNTIAPVHTFDLADDNKVPTYLIEHKRVTNSLAHQWLKQKILEQFN